MYRYRDYFYTRKVPQNIKNAISELLDDTFGCSMEAIFKANNIAKAAGVQLAIVSITEMLTLVPDAPRYDIDLDDILYYLHDFVYGDRYVIFGATVNQIVNSIQNLIDDISSQQLLVESRM